MHLIVHQALAHGRAMGLHALDVDCLFLHAVGRSPRERAWLRAHNDDPVSPDHLRLFQSVCERRLTREPLSYITGQREFFGLDLQVNSNVLDPRPDTETLVDWVLEVLQAHKLTQVADLGTGSGAIALAIKHQRPDVRVLAVDYSPDALSVATDNAARLKLSVQFELGSWFEPLATIAAYDFDFPGWQLIVSNPPYIAEGDEHLSTLLHEPLSALTSGRDGLEAIQHIVSDAPEYLAEEGWLLLEHGYDQAQRVRNLMQSRGFQDISTRNDLAGIERCTGGRWRSNRKAG